MAAALGGFLFGYDTSVINGTVNALEVTFGISSVALGFVVSAALIGAAFGAWFAGGLANRFGRTRVMLVAAVLFFVSSFGSALAVGPWDLVVWRVIGGIGVGAASVIAPAYIAEISPSRIRGRLGSLQQMAIVVGIFAALLVNFLIQKAAGGSNEPAPWGGTAWRWMFAAESIPAFIYFVVALQIPESPRYLVSKNKTRQAKKVLAKYVGGDVDAKVEEIQTSLKSDRPPRFGDIRGSMAGLMPIVWVGILLSVFQQFVGINVIFYYSNTLWQAVGFTEENSFLTSVITSITNVVATIIAIALIDKVGRKTLLLVGSSVMAVSLGTMSVLFATAPVVGEDPQLGNWEGPVALIAANLFVVGFAFSWGPTVWVLLGEMFPNRIRASALAVAAAAQWAANWIITTTFPELVEVGLGLAYGLYTAFAVLSFFFVLRFVPETKGVELEDMERLDEEQLKHH
ncbi:sugar porter family MFS transporter [Salininema proteolyticum]|uniref:Sugar porter family MFS transporter n=1 Tax=Salininema proteolyticum TaxID=1607685 RepID=A0ABV8U577_9ACTN